MCGKEASVLRHGEVGKLKVAKQNRKQVFFLVLLFDELFFSFTS